MSPQLSPLPKIPANVFSWVRRVFRGCNKRVSTKLSQLGNVHETSLDMTFIEHLSQFGGSHKVGPGWTVRIETHFLGGMRHFMGWEIADIGLLVFFSRRRRIVRRKAALLQSKRLYPRELRVDEETKLDYEVGMARLDRPFASTDVNPRTFHFGPDSKYRELVVGSDRYKAIAQYMTKEPIPVFYNLYNPLRLPHSVSIPIQGKQPRTQNEVGVRVVPAQFMHQTLDQKGEKYLASFEDATGAGSLLQPQAKGQGGWRLEQFVADILLRCKAGYSSDSEEPDQTIRRLFFGRTGPIASAVSIGLDSPE